MRGWLTRHRPELVHAVRLTTAGVAAFALFRALGMPQALWAVITALLVTQSSVGGSLKAAADQLVGSLFGAACGASIAFAMPPDGLLLSAAALVAALAPLSILAAFSAGFRIAPITAVIVLLGDLGPDMGPLGLAAYRILVVGLGCGVGLLVSALVVPAQASRSVLAVAARMATLMAEQLEALASRSVTGRSDLGALAGQIRESLNRMETLVENSARERRSWLTDVPDGTALLRTMVRLRYDLSMLRRTAREAGHDMLPEHLAELWSRAARSGAATLRGSSQVLSGRQAPEERNAFAQAVREYRGAVEGMKQTDLTGAFSTAALGRLFETGIVLEQFRRDLDDLLERSREIAPPRDRSAEA